MKKIISVCFFFIVLIGVTACQSQCHRCGWIKRNPITPKDSYYQEYYESDPVISS